MESKVLEDQVSEDEDLDSEALEDKASANRSLQIQDQGDEDKEDEDRNNDPKPDHKTSADGKAGPSHLLQKSTNYSNKASTITPGQPTNPFTNEIERVFDKNFVQ